MATEEEVLENQPQQQRVDRLAEIFGDNGTPLQGKALIDRLAQLRAAAFEEYELAFSGSRFPSTIKELRELRLSLLYEHLPDGLPTDDQIGELFQMTRTQVGTLIAGTRARFGPEVEKRVKREAKATLGAATKVDDNTVSVFAADSLAGYLSDLIARTHAPPLDKRRDASQTYYLGRTTIKELCKQLGIEPQQTVKVIKWS
jgi:hypothetical protein